MKPTFKKILSKAQKDKTIVAVFVDAYDLSSCSLGFVNGVTDEHLRMDSISPNGEPSGIEVIPLKEIFRIDCDGLYERKMAILYSSRGNIFKDLSFDSPTEESLIVDTVRKAKDNHVIIELWAEDDSNSVVGFVALVEKDYLKIAAIDEFGRGDGEVYIKIENIMSVDCGTTRCQQIQFLYERGNMD